MYNGKVRAPQQYHATMQYGKSFSRVGQRQNLQPSYVRYLLAYSNLRYYRAAD